MHQFLTLIEKLLYAKDGDFTLWRTQTIPKENSTISIGEIR